MFQLEWLEFPSALNPPPYALSNQFAGFLRVHHPCRVEACCLLYGNGLDRSKQSPCFFADGLITRQKYNRHTKVARDCGIEPCFRNRLVVQLHGYLPCKSV